MKKIYLLFIAAFMIALSGSASVAVCDIDPDENGHFNCPFIKSGSITWDESSKTLTLDNAVIEHSSESPYDYVYPIRITEDATIVIHGECRLTTTGFVALSLDGYDDKSVTLQGDGTLYLSSTWHGIYLRCARLTIKDITLNIDHGIANNGNGVLVALTFDNVNADITGGIERIGEGITFRNCAITYPTDAYIEHEEYGYYVASGDGNYADHIIISRGSSFKGDVNGDGEVNIADINAVIAVILGGVSNTAADVNNDGEVNIADVNAVINIILNPSSEEPDHEYVDLGLPSGTLWATCNIGASKPEEYGDYFAWGETTPKEVYTWETYKWCNGTNNTMTKYCTDSSFGTVDDKTELLPEDDAAYVNWGTSWRMPSQEQYIELSDNCTWAWTTLNDVKGHLITGPNGNTMFLPAAGDRYQDNIGDLGSYGQYWSRTLNDSRNDAANILFLHSYGLSGIDANDRFYGFSVRAVLVSQ